MYQRNFDWQGHLALFEAGHLLGWFSWEHGGLEACLFIARGKRWWV